MPRDGGTTFRAWAPAARDVQLRLFADAARATRTLALRPLGDGWFEEHVAGVGPGALYKLVLDGRELPDPYARFLPFGVHGPAEVIARAAPRERTRAVQLDRAVIYELHVGAFTHEGTYAAAAARLPDLVDLGVTAVELMPVAAWAGERGWGYDGAALFAPHAPYGRPEDLRAFVDAAHAAGLSVLLDVVYNHFGPSGNYLGAYASEYFTTLKDNPWGSAPSYAEPAMRRLAVDNARMWLDEYGFDGLRLDATPMVHDDSPRHVLRELADLAASCRPARLLVGEDDRNDPAVVTELGMDALWADDFHHQLRVVLTGERDGYYAAYAAGAEGLRALARAIDGGWIYEGQLYAPWGRPRGARADGLAPASFVYYVENHDQVGNRALGARLDRDVGAEALCAATMLLLFLPMTPLLFMGQEWAASSPFLYFTDHDAELGRLVAAGRREEFKSFTAFSDPDARARIPDPQARDTFERSKLRWDEREREPHRSVLQRVRAMLHLRRSDPVLGAPCARRDLRARVEAGLLVVERRGGGGGRVLLANLAPHPVASDLVPGGEPLLRTGAVAPGSIGPHAAGIWALP
jgi:maltooligosyltrehalose trehalohydrolase